MASFETAFLLISAFGLGLLHAFEVDHLTAVGAFVAARPRSRDAFWFGVKWALGHAVSLLLFGMIVFALKLALADVVTHWLERAVGVGLIGVGIYTLLKLKAHGVVHTHHHDNGSFWMGLLHGVAGTAAFVGQSIVVLSNSYAFVFAFTAAFSGGVLLAMAAYAFALGGFFQFTHRRSHQLAHVSRALMGVWSCGLGVFWILR